jgi:hypothetical protein
MVHVIRAPIFGLVLRSKVFAPDADPGNPSVKGEISDDE